jgi:hypothetical protein
MKAFTTAALLAIVTGCASAPEPTPTHYWESSAKAPENRYRMDNLACQSETQAETGSAVFEPGTESFDNYRECMVSRGYVLRQY